MKFSTIRGVVLDMDGVLWRGDEPLPGLQALFTWLAENGTPYVLATNNSSKTPTDYVAKLARMGVDGVPEASIITSSIATASYMQTRYPAGTRVYILGMNGLRHALDEAGFDVTDSMDEVQVVVSGIDFELTYDKLRRAALAIRAGADFIGTNGDLTFPAPEGLVPGAGSLLAALQAASGVSPTVVGKPYLPMFEAAVRMLGLEPAAALMVGDRLNTDIEGAQKVGMQTALVFTGVTQPDEMQTSDIWPDVAYEDLPALIRAWAGDDWWIAWQKAERQRR
jgi:4-nitrophenyl phosphatase